MRTLVIDHPLVAHKMSRLRREETSSATFRLLAEELVTLLAYEATRSLTVHPEQITTPVAPTTGYELGEPKPLVVPILRAGLGPMLATGGTLVASIDILLERGAKDVTAICLLAAPEGLAHMEETYGGRDADVTVVTAGLDERLNEKGYIVPGLGDAGDRLYGTV